MSKMNPEMKKRWLDALRSGKYTKGKGALRQRVEGSSSFCCLGVAVDIFLPGVRWVYAGSSGYAYCDEDGGRFTGLVGDGLMREMNLSHEHAENLAWVNDHSPTFDDVIRYIEDRL